MTRRLSLALIRLGASLVLRGMRMSSAFDVLDCALLREALSTTLRQATLGRPERVCREPDAWVAAHERQNAPSPTGVN